MLPAWTRILLIFLFGLSCAGCSTHPRNLTFIKADLTAYHQDPYPRRFAAVADRARHYLAARVKTLSPGTKAAVVFDIDETSLSNWPYLHATDYSTALPLFFKWTRRSACPPNLPVRAIYDEAQRLGVTVFFVTGRPEFLRAPTERNLDRAGYRNREHLYMRPADYREASIIPYKSGARREIEAKGYHIILNIGDQWSDLKGGYAERTFKLPNPFYYIR